MADWIFTPGVDVSALLRPLLAAAIQDTVDLIEVDAVRTAPYRTGKLASSSKTEIDRSELVGAVGFTDPKAVAAHENMHHRLRNGRRAKFLELSAAENAASLTEGVATVMRRVLG